MRSVAGGTSQAIKLGKGLFTAVPSAARQQGMGRSQAPGLLIRPLLPQTRPLRTDSAVATACRTNVHAGESVCATFVRHGACGCPRAASELECVPAPGEAGGGARGDRAWRVGGAARADPRRERPD